MKNIKFTYLDGFDKSIIVLLWVGGVKVAYAGKKKGGKMALGTFEGQVMTKSQRDALIAEFNRKN